MTVVKVHLFAGCARSPCPLRRHRRGAPIRIADQQNPEELYYDYERLALANGDRWDSEIAKNPSSSTSRVTVNR